VKRLWRKVMRFTTHGAVAVLALLWLVLAGHAYLMELLAPVAEVLPVLRP
jgi:hypothetical protein